MYRSASFKFGFKVSKEVREREAEETLSLEVVHLQRDNQLWADSVKPVSAKLYQLTSRQHTVR